MVGVKKTVSTRFAPAERAKPETVWEQSQYFSGFSLLHQLIDAVPDIVMVLNEHRQIVLANRALCEAVHRPRQAILGQRPGEALACVHASEDEGGCGTSDFCRHCGAVQAMLVSLGGRESVQECRITRADGSALDLLARGTPLESGGERFSIFAVKDISHEKRRRILERVFFHDLLNTAGGMRGFAEVLQEVDPEEMNDIRRMIYSLADQLIEEIESQRDLTAAENDELTPQPAPLVSVAVLNEVAALYGRHRLAAGRQIQVELDAHAVTFVNDKTLLRRVLGNLVKNALEASPPGATIRLTCQARPDSVEFAVHNPGYMRLDIQQQIFQRSFTTRGPGRGLGTYGIKLLTERYLRGRVSFTTSPEEGTLFRVCYPLMLSGT